MFYRCIVNLDAKITQQQRAKLSSIAWPWRSLSLWPRQPGSYESRVDIDIESSHVSHLNTCGSSYCRLDDLTSKHRYTAPFMIVMLTSVSYPSFLWLTYLEKVSDLKVAKGFESNRCQGKENIFAVTNSFLDTHFFLVICRRKILNSKYLQSACFFFRLANPGVRIYESQQVS